MFKGMKTTLVIVAMGLIGLVACNSEASKEKECETTCDSTKTDCVVTSVDTTTTDSAAVCNVSVTESVK